MLSGCQYEVFNSRKCPRPWGMSLASDNIVKRTHDSLDCGTSTRGNTSLSLSFSPPNGINRAGVLYLCFWVIRLAVFMSLMISAGCHWMTFCICTYCGHRALYRFKAMGIRPEPRRLPIFSATILPNFVYSLLTSSTNLMLSSWPTWKCRMHCL